MKGLRKNQHGRSGSVLFAFLVIFSLVAVQSYAEKAEGKGFLGVNIEKLTSDDREEFGVKFGVLVTGVTKDEAAFKAGLAKYDVIQFIGDVKVRRPDDVVEAVSGSAPGSKVKIRFVRDGKEMSVTAVLGERKKSEFILQRDGDEFRILGDEIHGKLKGLKELRALKELKVPGVWSSKKTAYLGVEMQTMDDNFASYFGVKKGGGALILKVTKDSAASKAGLLSGDVILKIDGMAVSGPGDVSKAIQGKQKGDTVKISVFRHKKIREFTAELGERSLSGRMFFGDNGHNIHIDIPRMVEDIMVWKDAAGTIHKEKFHLQKEKEMLKKEMMKQKEEQMKLKKLKDKELKEKLKAIQEEKEEEVFI